MAKVYMNYFYKKQNVEYTNAWRKFWQHWDYICENFLAMNNGTYVFTIHCSSNIIGVKTINNLNLAYLLEIIKQI